MVRAGADNRVRALTWINTQTCQAPKVAFTVFSQFLLIYPSKVQPADAIYVVLLVSTVLSQYVSNLFLIYYRTSNSDLLLNIISVVSYCV